MTRDKQLSIGALALVLFGGLAVKQMKDDAKLGSKAAQEASLPKLESAEGAEKLTVTNGDKGEFVLEKKGETWELVKPVAAKANGQNVKLALDNLEQQKVVTLDADRRASLVSNLLVVLCSENDAQPVVHTDSK